VGPFLEIPPTGHLVHMRFHEFYCFEDDKIIEVQAIWDIPELMMQAGAWPMSPSLGCEMFIPGPASQDGLTSANRASSHGTESLDVVIEMLTNLSRHPSEGGPEIMKAEEYWHPCVNWYGPAGIGSMRGLDGFRNWHQIPFLKALPDRKGGTTGTLSCHFFGDGPYVIATGWPNMQMTVSGDGWLGIAPSGQKITMRSLDFWRVENNLIRENWVLVDLLDVYSQIGVDVFSRLREFNKARVSGKVSYPIGLSI
ncbi:MAG: SnoaL-like domain-containing protein, partial [Rhodobacterales bacterium]|nr:SnoaL-like domain-containing protein [Rhodobacterales bacterium]